MSPTFGRDRELALIQRILTETAEGGGGCLVVSGPAGIGKSHLIRSAGLTARTLGVPVAARPALPVDRAAPLVTLASALRRCEPPTATFDWLHDEWGSPVRTIEQLRASLEDYTARQPLTVVIDDAQWMDELSALAIRELVPALASSPVRWVFGYRADGPGQGDGVLTALLREGADSIVLRRLDDWAVADLCAGFAGARVDDSVLDLSAGCDGNPLQLVQLLNHLRSSDHLQITDGVASVTGTGLPSGFLALVDTILDRLSDAARDLVRNGSVFGRPFSLKEAAQLIGRPPAEMPRIVEEAMRANVLTEQASGLTFSHDRVRQAVYESLSEPVAAMLHGEVAAISQAGGRPTVEVAEHLLRAGPADSREAADLLRAAADEVAGVAPATAADLILRAIEIFDRHDPQWAELCADAVVLLTAASRLPKARELAQDALRAGLPPETEARLLLGLAEAAKHLGHNAEAVGHADQALALTAISDATRAKLHAIRAHALFYTGDLPAADASGARADELGRSSGQHAASVFGLAARSLVAQAEGQFLEALAHATAATGLADRAGGEAVLWHPRIWLGNVQSTLDMFDEAEATFRRGRRESQQLGTAWSEPLWHYFYTALLTAQGRLDDAVAEAEAGVSSAERVTAVQLAVPLLGALSRLAVLRGESAQAGVHLKRMRSLMGTGITAAPEDVAWTEAVVLDAGKGPAAAAPVLSGIYAALTTRPVLIGQDPAAAAALVRIALAAGEQDKAESVVAAARRLAGYNPNSQAAAAAAAQAEGLLHGDAALLGRAVELFGQTRRPLALAAALETAADADAAADRPEAARTGYAKAREIAAGRGATGLVRRLDKRLGRRTPRAVVPRQRGSKLDVLSGAERRVAVLVADGRTNIQAATELKISPHTVDTHMRRIFSKLEINRRAQLVRLLAEEGRDD